MLYTELNKLVKGESGAYINQVNTAHLLSFAGEFSGTTHDLSTNFALFYA